MANPHSFTNETTIPPDRLGQISFVNCLPVVLPIEHGHVSLEANVIFGPPGSLNRAYATGDLDLGAMSAFFFLENGDLQFIPHLSISSDGAVGSVLLFSKTNLDQLDGKRIVVPASSATSVNLLKVLLAEQFGVKPEIVIETKPSLSDSKNTAALIIGDLALTVDKDWSAQYLRVDLGQWWHTQTGLPMVFGVWAARKNWSVKNDSCFQSIGHALKESVDLGLSTLFPLVSAEAIKRTALSASRIEHYFKRELNYQFTSRHQEGLEQFHQLCLRHQLYSNDRTMADSTV